MPGARIISEFSAFKLSKIGLYHKLGLRERDVFAIVIYLTSYQRRRQKSARQEETI